MDDLSRARKIGPDVILLRALSCLRMKEDACVFALVWWCGGRRGIFARDGPLTLNVPRRRALPPLAEYAQLPIFLRSRKIRRGSLFFGWPRHPLDEPAGFGYVEAPCGAARPTGPVTWRVGDVFALRAT